MSQTVYVSGTAWTKSCTERAASRLEIASLYSFCLNICIDALNLPFYLSATRLFLYYSKRSIQSMHKDGRGAAFAHEQCRSYTLPTPPVWTMCRSHWLNSNYLTSTPRSRHYLDVPHCVLKQPSSNSLVTQLHSTDSTTFGRSREYGPLY